MIIKKYNNYSEEEILGLYTDAGWVAYTQDPETLRKGYENSLLILAAYDGEELLGIIRAVGDGETVIFIQDILVYKRYQRQGIGTALLKACNGQYGKDYCLLQIRGPQTSSGVRLLRVYERVEE